MARSPRSTQSLVREGAAAGDACRRCRRRAPTSCAAPTTPCRWHPRRCATPCSVSCSASCSVSVSPSRSMRSTRACARRPRSASTLGLPLLARIPPPPKKLAKDDELVMIAQPRAAPAEAFRVLRTNLDFARLGVEDARSVLAHERGRAGGQVDDGRQPRGRARARRQARRARRPRPAPAVPRPLLPAHPRVGSDRRRARERNAGRGARGDRPRHGQAVPGVWSYGDPGRADAGSRRVGTWTCSSQARSPPTRASSWARRKCAGILRELRESYDLVVARRPAAPARRRRDDAQLARRRAARRDAAERRAAADAGGAAAAARGGAGADARLRRHGCIASRAGYAAGYGYERCLLRSRGRSSALEAGGGFGDRTAAARRRVRKSSVSVSSGRSPPTSPPLRRRKAARPSDFDRPGRRAHPRR